MNISTNASLCRPLNTDSTFLELYLPPSYPSLLSLIAEDVISSLLSLSSSTSHSTSHFLLFICLIVVLIISFALFSISRSRLTRVLFPSTAAASPTGLAFLFSMSSSPVGFGQALRQSGRSVADLPPLCEAKAPLPHSDPEANGSR